MWAGEGNFEHFTYFDPEDEGCRFLRLEDYMVSVKNITQSLQWYMLVIC
jgi:hypothetical protein